LLSAILVLGFGIPTSRAGVTLITHGFNADAEGWVNAMGTAIEAFPRLILTNTTTYEIYFEQNTSGGYTPKQRKLRGSEHQSPRHGMNRLNAPRFFARPWSNFAQ
jgi:hypothetical protein